MFSVLRTRTRFERNLFLVILSMALILGGVSILSLVMAQHRFTVLLERLWSGSGGEALQADLVYFAGRQINDLAAEGAELIARIAADLPRDPGHIDLGRSLQEVGGTGKGSVGLMPRALQLYVKSGDGWDLAKVWAGGSPDKALGEGSPDPAHLKLRPQDLDEFVNSASQPKQRWPGMIVSLADVRGVGMVEDLGLKGSAYAVAALVSTTSPEFAEHWQRSISNVERPSFAPVFSQLIWLQLSWLVVALSVIALAAVVISRILSGRMSRPLADLVAAMERVGSGDLSFRAVPSEQQEFGYLVESFNSMATSIQQLNEETRQTARMKRELEMGREIQMRLLPEALPQLPGYDLFATNVPSLELSGDYYDARPWGSGDDVLLAIADVAGKGLPAALVMSNAQACLRSQALKPPNTLGECASVLNELILRSTDETTFVTIFLATLSPGSRRLAYVNAGHPPTVLVRDNGEVMKLDRGGPLVGMLPGVTYEWDDIVLQDGDILCMYTDGIVEALGDNEEEFGYRRMLESISASRSLSAREIAFGVIEAVRAHSKTDAQSDDITILVLKVSA